MADLKKQLKAIKNLLGDGRDLQLSDADALQYQDILCLLEERGRRMALIYIARWKILMALKIG